MRGRLPGLPNRVAVPFGTDSVHLTKDDGIDGLLMLGVYDKVQTPGKRKTLSPKDLLSRERG